VISELRGRAERLAPRARISWASAERLHLTVRFIGHVEESKARAIEQVFQPAWEVDPFELTFAGIGTFPPRGDPRVLRAGVTAGLEAISMLERQVTLRLARVNVAAEERPYRPHLTLARVREAAGLRSASLCEGLSDIVLGTIRVEASTLFESRLSSKEPEYVALHKTVLGGR
jgi:2'-5' RNA ligase